MRLSNDQPTINVAVVAGASAGIGRATALAFAKAGASVALLARNRDRLESLRAVIETRGCRALAITVDVANASAVEAAAVRIENFNTPQFDWSRSRLLNRVRPMPPVYQPELAANAIVWAARRGGREVKVGMPALLAIWADKRCPTAGDWYLSRVAYTAQQTLDSKAPNTPDNLDSSVAGEFGSHGRFDREAHTYSLQFGLVMHSRAVIMVVAAVLALFTLRLAS